MLCLTTRTKNNQSTTSPQHQSPSVIFPQCNLYSKNAHFVIFSIPPITCNTTSTTHPSPSLLRSELFFFLPCAWLSERSAEWGERERGRRGDARVFVVVLYTWMIMSAWKGASERIVAAPARWWLDGLVVRNTWRGGWRLRGSCARFEHFGVVSTFS